MTGDMNIDREQTQLSMNIADESALEAALGLCKNRKGENREEGLVRVLSMGTLKMKPILSDLIARGADNCMLLSDRAFAGADTYATAYTLAGAIPADTDLIFAGRRAMDGETGQVPAEIAARLGWELITNVLSVAHEEGGGLIVRRMLDSGEETLILREKAVLSFCEYSYHLRLPSIRGRRNAMKTEVQVLDAAALTMKAEDIGMKGSLTKVISSTMFETGKRKGKRTGDAAEAAEDLKSLLKKGGDER